MKLEHAMFIKRLNDYLRDHPTITIGQALIEIGAIQKVVTATSAISKLYKIKDVSKDSDEEILKRML